MDQSLKTHLTLDHPDVVRLQKLARRMDNAYRLPIIGVRLGWDSILGLVPVVGDILAVTPALFIVQQSQKMGVGPTTVARMGVNIGVDLVIGAIPLVGDVFDIGWNANIRNVELLHKHILRKTKSTNSPSKA